jgi:hypothetical protein
MVNNGRKEKRKQTILSKERIDGEGRHTYIERQKNKYVATIRRSDKLELC